MLKTNNSTYSITSEGCILSNSSNYISAQTPFPTKPLSYTIPPYQQPPSYYPEAYILPIASVCDSAQAPFRTNQLNYPILTINNLHHFTLLHKINTLHPLSFTLLTPPTIHFAFHFVVIHPTCLSQLPYNFTTTIIILLRSFGLQMIINTGGRQTSLSVMHHNLSMITQKLKFIHPTDQIRNVIVVHQCHSSSPFA